jgi:hypothetical protein
MDSYEFIQQLIMQKQQTLHKLKPLQSLSDILMMSYQLEVVSFVIEVGRKLTIGVQLKRNVKK